MAAIINYRVRVTLNDSRALVGQLLAFDKHMNLVLAECDEFRRIKRKGSGNKAQRNGGAEGAAAEEDDEEDEMKRTLGLVILRGETIVSLSGAFPCFRFDDEALAEVCADAVCRLRHAVEGPPPATEEKGLAGVSILSPRPCDVYSQSPDRELGFPATQLAPGPGFGAPAGRGMGLAAPPTMCVSALPSARCLFL